MIISFSQLGKHGRLGNQLFQVASTLGMAERYGAEAAFPEWAYEKYFEFSPLPTSPKFGQAPNLGEGLPRIQEKQFGFYDWNLTESCDLFGYLQSEKYFGSTKLKFKQSFLDEVIAKAGTLFDKPTVCVQIRRGDYVGNPNYYQIPINWYIDALRGFVKWQEYNILFVSDDIEYCKVHFECLPNAFFGGISDISDLALASLCDHFIISNSSFGWWCAWLGEKPHSKIIHCGELHSGKLSSNGHADYYPSRWTERKGFDKIPLRDVTFTIPVLFDHADRKANLELCLYMLQAAFDTNIIIMEQGGNRFEYTKRWAKYMQCDAKIFHRTKMLNDMCNAAETGIIANWDCDVIIPPMQILMAVEELRAGADMVFPYDGKFARMPRVPWYPQLQKVRDIGIAGATPFKGREDDHNSVGGAVMFNKAAFIDGGMENEHFISFGPEDCERNDRFTKLGFDVRRVKGALFHLNHYVGVNSSPRNPHFQANHAELKRIREMSRDELWKYVDTWTWRHPYTERYYARISEGAIRSAKIVMDELSAISDQRSAFSDQLSVIDVGCGLGEWSNGNPNYWGVDFRVDKSKLLFPAERFIECDLERDFVKLDRKFDLCICLEVAEHLRPHRAEGLVKMLCELSDQVLFSAAIPYQGGVGHVNEQWQSYWAELFEINGFGSACVYPVWKNNLVDVWYRNNMVLYSRQASHNWPVNHLRVFDFVLPEFYQQIVGHLRAEEKNETR